MKNWFVLLIVLVSLAGCKVATSRLLAVHNPVQKEIPSEKRTQGVGLDMVSATPNLTDMLVYRWTSISPDGQWIAEGIQASPKLEAYQTENVDVLMFYTRLILQSIDGKKLWTIVDEWEEVGLGMGTLRPVHWSSDGRNFYYTNVYVPDGCGGGPFNNGWDLHKVDLDTGAVSEVISKIDRWLAVSPDGTTVAYMWGGVVLYDLASGQERKVSIDIGKEYTGKIVWSPDNKLLAVTLAIAVCDTLESAESTSILLVDVASLEVQTVLSEDKRYLVAEEWLDTAQIVLKDLQGNKWILNTKSGEIIQP